MTRTIQDPDLQLWEVYATAAKSGFPQRSRMVFHCLTDPGRRARFLERDGDKAEVEHEVATLAPADLVGLLARAADLG